MRISPDMIKGPTASLLPQTNIQFYAWVYELGYTVDDIAYFQKVYSLSQQVFGRQFRACGKPFTAHLIGTAAAVSLEKPSRWVVGYALCHLAVENGQYAAGLSLAAKREQFLSVVGQEAGSLNDAYKITQSMSVSSLADLCADDSVLSAFQRLALLVWLANELDDHVDNGLRFSSKKEADANQRASILKLARKFRWKRLEQLGVAIFDDLNDSAWITPLASTRKSAYTIDQLTGKFSLSTRIRWKIRRIRRYLRLS